MNISDLTVYKSPYPKVRVGKNYDGGYVIADIPDIKYSCVLSGGISNDISFEEEFIQKYHVNCYAFDGTIGSLPKNSTINFTRKNIGGHNNEKTTNLHEFLDSNDNIFIKMDIEGGEFAWLQSLNQQQMDKISQLVIEFHQPFKHTIFNKLSNHVLIHFHGNNCCGTRPLDGVQVPRIFECTFIHKKYITDLIKNIQPLPSHLDMRNLPFRPDIILNYPPFVSSHTSNVLARKPIGVINGRWFIRNPLVSKS